MTCAKCGCTIGYDCFCLGCPGGCGAPSPEQCRCNEPTEQELGEMYAEDDALPFDVGTDPGEEGWQP